MTGSSFCVVGNFFCESGIQWQTNSKTVVYLCGKWNVFVPISGIRTYSSTGRWARWRELSVFLRIGNCCSIPLWKSGNLRFPHKFSPPLRCYEIKVVYSREEGGKEHFPFPLLSFFFWEISWRRQQDGKCIKARRKKKKNIPLLLPQISCVFSLLFF